MLKILFFFLTSLTFACEITLPEQILLFERRLNNFKIEHTGCSFEAQTDFNAIINDLEGKVASFQLKELMLAKGHEVIIKTSSIKVQHLTNLVRDQLHLPAGVEVKNGKTMIGDTFIVLGNGDEIQLECSSCLLGSQQNMKLSITAFSGEKKTVYLQADFIKMVKAYRLLAPLSSFSQLRDISVFKEETVPSIPHTDLITDLNELKYYQTNKPIRAGELLRRSDLSATDLVKAGLKTEVILETPGIRIKTQGISRSNGAIGELVEVFQPQKNKKYQGKVIDLNRVLVEL
jgi:flagella basal body P-ring formation protein FlgA